jgi:hypothetical protein
MSLFLPESSQKAFRPRLSVCHSRGKHADCNEPCIVAEYRRVFPYSKFTRYGFPPQWLEFLIESALRFPDGETWPRPLPDPDDACSFPRPQTGAWHYRLSQALPS